MAEIGFGFEFGLLSDVGDRIGFGLHFSVAAFRERGDNGWTPEGGFGFELSQAK